MVKTSDYHLNRELILLPYIYTHAQVIGKLVGSIMNSPVPKKNKKISNNQELIQSDPISCPQNQKGNN